MASWDDYTLKCIHGVYENLDSHGCAKCQTLAKEIGLKPLSTGYIFTTYPSEAEKARLRKQYG